MMSASPRIAPGAACQSCRWQKMKCIREAGSSACVRCIRNRRPCVAAESEGSTLSQSRKRRRISGPSSAQSQDNVTSQSPAGLVETHEQAEPILPSIYSTSPYANHVGQDRYSAVSTPSTRQASITLPATVDLPAFSHEISNEDTAQLIEIFRDRLLLTIPLLVPDDFKDAPALITRSPHLVACISYVTAHYIPGYQDVRKSLTPVILSFIHTAITTKIRDTADEVAMMQAFLVLCVFTRSNIIDKDTEADNSGEISFWTVKTASEAFALRIHLHRAADGLKRQMQAGKPVKRSDIITKKYLYWLWLFTLSHHVSIVTGTPPALRADASIRSAPQLLKHLKSHDNVLLLLGEVGLCLLWDKLGKKDISLKEWWCSSELQEQSSSHNSKVTFEDVDTALSEWRVQSNVDHIANLSRGVMSLSLDYHYNYTRFCLNTHFIRHIHTTTLSPTQKASIERSMTSAISVLELSSRVGPLMRDQLRYFPGFIFVTISFCSVFILQAIRKFPEVFPNPKRELELLRKAAGFMNDLGAEKNAGARTAGQSIARQLELTTELMNRRQEKMGSHAGAETSDIAAVDGGGQSVARVERVFDDAWGGDVDNPFSNVIFGFPGFFDANFQGLEYADEASASY